MKKYIPEILLYSRLLLAIVIIVCIFINPPNSRIIVLVLMYTGIITDIFDGIIARNLNRYYRNFRVLDTLFDLLFYLSVFGFIIVRNPQDFLQNSYLICGILSLELLMYMVSILRFGKLPSPHALLSKFWGLYLVTEFSLLILGIKGSHFTIALAIGIFVHFDRLLIYLLLRKWEHDIPSSWHALRLRQGKPIRRMGLFNG
jgi:CDP-diacylglycerol---glycerol-3-phosphate 3-phosphatidyltransferase